MMKEMGYGLCHGEDLNFGKRDASLYNFSTKEKACQLPRSDSQRVGIKSFIPKGKPANYNYLTRRGLEYITPSIQSDSISEKSLPSHSSDPSD